MITEQESTYNWQFLYLGADQDAIEVGGKMGIAPGRSLTYGRGSSQQAYAATSAVVGAMRTMAAEGASPAAVRSAGFSEHDRESAG